MRAHGEARATTLNTMMNNVAMKIRYAGAGGVLCAALSMNAWAGNFELNFAPHGNSVAGIDIPVGGVIGDSGGNDGTGFTLNYITIGGKQYFHVVVQDANSDFKQESYTSAVVQNISSFSASDRSFSPDSGGMERSMIGGKSVVNMDGGAIVNWPRARVGSAKDPFGYRVYSSPNDTVGTVVPVDQRYRISGNGTMNPSRTVLLMQASDSSVSIEVYKPQLDRKPRISQTLVDGAVTSRFMADMRGLTYSDMNKDAVVTNTLALNDPGLPVKGGADFDLSFAQKSNVTAGKYIFTPGAGWSAPLDPTGSQGWNADGSTFDPGAYTYSEGGFDVLNVDWTSFFDPAQNPRSQVNLN